MSWLLITYEMYKAEPYKEEMIDDDTLILFKKMQKYADMSCEIFQGKSERIFHIYSKL